MTSNDITELEWLASSLAGVASKLLRAAKLLRCEHDLERAEARLAAIAAVPSGREMADVSVHPRPPAVRPDAITAESDSSAALVPVGGPRASAVFDLVAHDIRTAGKTKTGVRRAPF